MNGKPSVPNLQDGLAQMIIDLSWALIEKGYTERESLDIATAYMAKMSVELMIRRKSKSSVEIDIEKIFRSDRKEQ